MSGEGERPGQATDFQKALANFVASVILAIGQIVYSIFQLIFSILASLTRI